MRQKTIHKKVEIVGIGLHKGVPVKMVLEPMEANCGIIFYRSDLGVTIPLKSENVVNTEMATVIGRDGAIISTIEHLLSAIYSYGIDNLRISVDNDEIPIMDGSSIPFCMLLDEAGVRELDTPKKLLIIKKDIEIVDGNKIVKMSPTNEVSFNFKIDFTHPIIGKQEFEFEFSKENYIKEIARARTFGFLQQVQYLRSRGLGLGGSLENAIILDEKKILNPEGLRFSNEFVRHKILDAIGDLSLLGYFVIGEYSSVAGSHNLNHKLCIEILKDSENYDIVQFELEREYKECLI